MSSYPPLRIESLGARGFRNLAPLLLTPGSHFNVLYGDNGAGKSNVLEAIYYLGALQSFRAAKTDDLVAIGEDTATIEASIAGESLASQLRVRLSRSDKRVVQINAKRPASNDAWQRQVPMVLFHPGDITLSTGGADRRRAFVDRILEQVDATYGVSMRNYDKALRSRNRLLKDERTSRTALGVYDVLLSQYGAKIGQARRRLLAQLGPRASLAFEAVFGEHVTIDVTYHPRVEPDEHAITSALQRAYDKDRARGFTADGPHGDDVLIRLKSVAARFHGSQGQQRAIVLSLKVAELDLLTELTGRVPVLLLDDVSSELDRERNRRFFATLQQLGGQVFMTTTHPEFILLDEARVDYRVESGRVTLA